MYSNRQRITAFVTCLAMVLVMLSSVAFILKEANHECSGQDCPVCTLIYNAERTISGMGTATDEESEAATALVVFFAVCLFAIKTSATNNNLVSLKVRLNN